MNFKSTFSLLKGGAVNRYASVLSKLNYSILRAFNMLKDSLSSPLKHVKEIIQGNYFVLFLKMAHKG